MRCIHCKTPLHKHSRTGSDIGARGSVRCWPELGVLQIFIFEAGEGVVRAHHIPIRQKRVFDVHWRAFGVSPLINGHPDAGTSEGHTPQK